MAQQERPGRLDEAKATPSERQFYLISTIYFYQSGRDLRQIYLLATTIGRPGEPKPAGELLWIPDDNDIRDEIISTFAQSNGTTNTKTTRAFRCCCPMLDELALKLRNRQMLERATAVEAARGLDVFSYDERNLFAANETQQLVVFGKLSRNRLARRLNLGKIMSRLRGPDRQKGDGGRQVDLASLALYHLERLCVEANGELAKELGQSARSTCSRLLSVWLDCQNEEPLLAALEDDYHQRSLMMPARRAAVSWQKFKCPSSDSGIEEENQNNNNKRHEMNLKSSGGQLSEIRANISHLLDIKCSKQVQTIVQFTLDLFQSMLAASPLFCLQTKRPLGSANQLNLFACVQCQQLRARLRFEWLERCLLLAFSQVNDYRRESQGEKQTSASKLPPIEAILDNDNKEQRFYNIVNLILGHLLRNHFLLEALELLVGSVESFLQSDLQEHQKEPILCIPIELIEANGGKLELSRPGELLKGALSLLVDEISGICVNLPRIETLLQFQGRADSGYQERPTCLAVLGHGDSLVADTKTRIHNLIDRVMSTNKPMERNEAPASLAHIYHHDYDGHQIRLTKWTQHQRDYEHIVVVVNAFRAGEGIDALDLAQTRRPEWRLEDSNLDLDGRQEESPMAQLELSGKQIQLLDELIFKLNCKMGRYFHFGHLIRLDFAPTREKLIKNVKNERLLLVRVKSDELLRFFERLRLQFDEIELGVDLEAAIQDYLSERWHAKQSQQPKLEQQLLLSGEDDHQMMELFEEEQQDLEDEDQEEDDDDDDNQEANKNDDQAMLREPSQEEEEEDFVNALVGNNPSNNVAQLFALSNPKGVPAGELAGNDSNRVAPLIECRLLVARREFLSKLLCEDLDQLAKDVRFALSGLVFLSEFGAHLDDQTLNEQPIQFELINEVACRVQLFGLMLADSMKRLEEARSRLLQLNKRRSQVLSKVVLEFDLLMQELGRKRLSNNLEEDKRTGEPEDKLVGSLDSIQESSDWAQKLQLRLKFLERQNNLLDKEAHLLARAKVKLTNRGEKSEVEKVNNDEFHLRGTILDKWSSTVDKLAAFWRLVDEFETQQVRWLNSDSKRVNYLEIVESFQVFRRRARSLGQQFEQRKESNLREQLHQNLAKFQWRLDEFAQRRLPLFKFLTNKHLSEAHWRKLSQLVGGRQIVAQNYTTVAQLLEVELIKQFVDQLDEMSRQATIEHELSLLLLAECSTGGGLRRQLRMLEVSSHLANWTDKELELAASRFITTKLAQSASELDEIGQRQLADRMAQVSVACHLLIKRYLRLSGSLNLINMLPSTRSHQILPKGAQRAKRIVLRSNQFIGSEQQLRPSMLIEFLRLFTSNLLEEHEKCSRIIADMDRETQNIESHLADIDLLIGNVKQLNESDLQQATSDSEQMLAQLEIESRNLELEREILATKEALALERQREALRGRDECIRQISERAIPAIRAATRAIDCLGDGRCLRTLRSLSRPRPPRAVRLVIEAVCLLRNSSLRAQDHTATNQTGVPSVTPLTTPERRINFVSGQIIEDFWPLAWRTINGVHSSKFLADLRQLDKRKIPTETMRLIRRKYLSEFHLETIERISREAALLARWLVAVDVFDRVINMVRPNYKRYLEADRCLGELLLEVSSRRLGIESIERNLELIQDSISSKVNQRVSLIDLLNECSRQASSMLATRTELTLKLDKLRRRQHELTLKRGQLVNRCFWRAFRLVYLDALRFEDHNQLVQLIRLPL